MTSELIHFWKSTGIFINISPPYEPERNKLIQRIVQKNWTRHQVLMFATNLPKAFWGEEITYANWLPFSCINNRIPILEWEKSVIINFGNILEFGAHGYSFIYYPRSVEKKNLLPRSELSRFVGMESDTRLIRVFVLVIIKSVPFEGRTYIPSSPI